MGRNAGLFMFLVSAISLFSIYRVGIISLSLRCVRALGLPSLEPFIFHTRWACIAVFHGAVWILPGRVHWRTTETVLVCSAANVTRFFIFLRVLWCIVILLPTMPQRHAVCIVRGFGFWGLISFWNINLLISRLWILFGLSWTNNKHNIVFFSYFRCAVWLATPTSGFTFVLFGSPWPHTPICRSPWPDMIGQCVSYK